ncbi:MAG: hypothetical protein GC181_08410 [Bacteroidetes bacterium]|nr:hypothetical protein [Bacteroidota bacterium]
MRKYNTALTFAGILLCLSSVLKAQSNLNYPYSISGVGLIQSDNFHNQRLMGGLNTAVDSSGSFSFYNPASLSNVAFTDLEFGIRGESVDQKSLSTRNAFNTGSFQYVGLALPINQKREIAVAVGLQPYSAMNYTIQNEGTEDSVDVFKNFVGKGGINQFRFAIGGRIYKGWSAGVTVAALFGNARHQGDKLYPSNKDLFSFRNVQNDYYSGVYSRFGVQYNGRIGKNYNHTFGITYALPSHVTVTSDQTVRTYNSDGNFYVDSVISRTNGKSSLTLPSGFSVGYSFSRNERWLIGLQYSMDKWSEFTDLHNRSGYFDQTGMSFGGYYQIMSYTDWLNKNRKDRKLNYFKVIRFYGGVNYNQLYMNSFTQQVTETGISFGLGLPVVRSARLDKNQITWISKINVGVEYVQRGTTSNGLIQENLIRLNVGTNFNDKWFTKRKYQ